ncbi:TA system antitoxin ParD family protein [Croceibacterium mercuriale]|uniref:TA system antitoxin ParD family protein n=1 Tax=Croceibacterium mercuriale TaxID=1572751 RepID=UPI00068CDE68|nr:hypothetical protein [Croceibacterium mercuriale]
MAQSVKLGDDIMSTVRRESELQSRSVAGQITHWLRIGRAIERSGRYDQARINAALAGELESGVLSDEEHDVWLDSFVERMGKAGPEEERFFGGWRRLGQVVGN